MPSCVLMCCLAGLQLRAEELESSIQAEASPETEAPEGQGVCAKSS